MKTLNLKDTMAVSGAGYSEDVSTVAHSLAAFTLASKVGAGMGSVFGPVGAFVGGAVAEAGAIATAVVMYPDEAKDLARSAVNGYASMSPVCASTVSPFQKALG